MVRRNGSLDVLRAAAIIMVVNCHIASFLEIQGPIGALKAGGKGVDLFFVLSGWLLGHQLLKELRDAGSLEIRRFWYRRWLRTLPAYYAVLALTLAWQVFAVGNTEPQLGYLVFAQNYQARMPYFSVSWSLCVEEHFYLLVAPALLLFFRVKWSRLFLAALLLVPLLCRQMGWYGAAHQTHIRYDQCAVGVLLAWIEVFAPAAWRRLTQWAPYLAVAALAALCYPLLVRLEVYPLSGEFDPVCYAALFGVLVLLANSSPFFKERVRSRFVSCLADRAYAIYLLHPEALAVLRRFPALPTALSFVLVWALSLIFAEALYRMIERPFMQARELFSATCSRERRKPNTVSVVAEAPIVTAAASENVAVS
jgi:peptidoglycan/LPS O-acetylase OafA/YrhL